MTYTVTITSQGQISLPVKVRRELFAKANKALVSVQDGKVTLEPVPDLLTLGGLLKTTKKPLSSGELHERFAHATVDNLKKKGVLKRKK